MSEEPRQGAGARLRQYEALLEVSESITRHGDLPELFHDLAGRLRWVVPFDFLLLLLHDADTNAMRLHVLESEQPGRLHRPEATPLESPGGWVWDNQQPLIIPDYEQETRFPLMPAVWRGYGMRSGCYAPL